MPSHLFDRATRPVRVHVPSLERGNKPPNNYYTRITARLPREATPSDKTRPGTAQGTEHAQQSVKVADARPSGFPTRKAHQATDDQATGTHRRTTIPTPATPLARRAKSRADSADWNTGSTTQPVNERELSRTAKSTARLTSR
jgi:hypothetical protein